MIYRDLTELEVEALPLEMRCCWFVCPWNVSMIGTTVQEWAEQVGYMAYPNNSSSIMNIGDVNAVTWANDEAERLITFVKQMVK